jgi:hypothetical protein
LDVVVVYRLFSSSCTRSSASLISSPSMCTHSSDHGVENTFARMSPYKSKKLSLLKNGAAED